MGTHCALQVPYAAAAESASYLAGRAAIAVAAVRCPHQRREGGHGKVDVVSEVA